MKKVILDTNMLMAPGQFMVDIFSEIERVMREPYVLVVLDKSLNELEKLAKGKGKDGQAARLGLALVQAQREANPTLWEKLLGLGDDRKEQRIQIVKAGAGYVDDAIFRLADDETIVATNDAKLKHRLQKQKIPVAILKGKKYIHIQ